MELFLEFLFTISLSFVLSFIIAKLLSLSSIIDQHLESVSRSCMEVSNESEKYVLECEKGLGFVSEAVKVDALGESVEENDTLEGCLNNTYGSAKNLEDETSEIRLAEDDEEEIEVLEFEEENGEDCLKKDLSDDDWERIERTELEKDFGTAVFFLQCRNIADQSTSQGSP